MRSTSKKSERHKYHKRILRSCRAKGAFVCQPIIRSPSPKSIRVIYQIALTDKAPVSLHTLRPLCPPCSTSAVTPSMLVLKARSTPSIRRTAVSGADPTAAIPCPRSPAHSDPPVLPSVWRAHPPFQPGEDSRRRHHSPKNPKTEPTVFQTSLTLRALRRVQILHDRDQMRRIYTPLRISMFSHEAVRRAKKTPAERRIPHRTIS